jgi:hypothetical protein
MSRKIKYKAQELDTKKWVFGYYFSDGNLHFIIGLDNYHYSIDPSTLCQLFTTKIGNIEIYEYDCWYANNHFILLHYGDNGMIYYQIYNENIEYKDYSEYCIMADIDKIITDHKFIGNWHDGQQYLLNKIKKVGSNES